MRYVTTERTCQKHENGIIVHVYREKRLDAWDVLVMITVTVLMAMMLFFGGMYAGTAKVAEKFEQTENQVAETVTEADEEYSEVVPLTQAEQKALYDAAEEFGIDYYVMLGLIDKETDFRNISGDRGNASGYCQIWQKWWSGKMRDIGAEDLNVPEDNFRTACAIMRELTDRYGSTAGALTAYNSGSYNGKVSAYATEVLANAEKWRMA
jgi:soluble lytic murein transglycosylase-like protein